MTVSTINQSATATSWTLDPAHTSVEFAAKHLMITTVKGRFSDVSGTIKMNEANPATSSVKAVIKAASIDTRTEQRDAHLKSVDFLEVERYPEITFTSTKVEPAGEDRYRITGDLTIHGITKSTVLDVTDEGRTKDPWGGVRAGFSATTRIDRRDFGLTWNQVLESGGVVVGNEIRITIEVEATKDAP